MVVIILHMLLFYVIRVTVMVATQYTTNTYFAVWEDTKIYTFLLNSGGRSNTTGYKYSVSSKSSVFVIRLK